MWESQTQVSCDSQIFTRIIKYLFDNYFVNVFFIGAAKNLMHTYIVAHINVGNNSEIQM